MKILLTGEPGAGKSTIAMALAAADGRSPRGFVTKKTARRPDGFWPVYIGVPGAEIALADANLAGLVYEAGAKRFPQVFDTWAKKTLGNVTEGSLVMMDELGFLESAAETFKALVLEKLRGRYDIIAVIKPKHTPFLDEVRAVKDVRLFTVTRENRDSLKTELIRLVESGRSE